jgi:hypothetical protein
MADNYQILIKKLDAFIRKYYKNQIIKGVIYSIAALIVFYLSIALLEYFAYLGTVERTVIFYLYLVVSALILFKLILIPLFKIFRIGKLISHRQAADIIGLHFTNVQDRLLNTLQLKELSDKSSKNTDLINASIDQRIAQLKPIPFSNAIDFKTNRKYLKFAIPPVLVVLILLLASPSIITEPTNRIIQHSENFEREAPFKFVLENTDLTAIQQEDFTIKVKIEGESVPDQVFISRDGVSQRMRKVNNVLYTHTFRNLQNNLDFNFQAEKFSSKNYTLRVLPKPIVLSFATELDYPDYIGRQDEVLDNTGDLIIPEGTNVKWNFQTRDASLMNMQFRDSSFSLALETSNLFTFGNQFFKSQPYSISIQNEHLKNTDSLLFSISVIPDVYPSINVEEFSDSIYDNRLYFRGFIKDDYGFKSLVFFHKYSNNPNKASSDKYQSQTLKITKQSIQQQFFHFFDLASLDLQAGEEVEYFFEVWDNDAINGSKSTRSQKMIFKAPSFEELEEKSEAASEQIKDNMEGALKDLQLLQKDIDEMSKKLFEKKTFSWQEKQQLQDLLNRQMSIQEKIDNLQKVNDEKLRNEEQYKEVDEELLRKHEELQKMMEDLLTDEMKEMMEEIQKLLDELDKDKVNEMMEEMKMNSEELEKELDRNLELFKQLEFEQKLQETIDKLKELSEKQEELSEETKENEANEDAREELKEKQEQLNKEFDELRKDMDDLEKKNEALEEPNDMENTDADEQEIEDEMQESSESLENQQNSKASESQKGASKKMQKLSESMQQMMDDMQMEEMGEDIETLREILENLLQVSFDQEDLMARYTETSTSDPKYVSSIEEQKNLLDDMDMIADSLHALSKRQMAIKPIVTKELSAINYNIGKAVELMDNRRIGQASESQQLVMTSVNNLALLLGEALEQMQQQMMQMQSSGSGSCSKPGKPGGSGSAKMKSMKQLQQSLNQQLQDMKDGKQPGKKQGQGQQMSEQLARSAAQQAAIRRQMESFRDQLKEEGRGNNGEVAKMLEDMEKTEKEIVNNNVTQQTLKRQEEILTRLLKSEKAELQREEEQRRESQEARNYEISNPDEFFEYNKIKNREVELLKTVPPNLNPFYKNKVTEYFYRFEDR